MTVTIKPINRNLYKQKGVALITTLFLLLLMIIIGMAGMRTTTLEEKMSANLRDKTVAFQAAESALKEAEAILDGVIQLSDFNDSGINGYYSSTNDQDSPWETIDWNDEAIVIEGLAITETTDAPRYIIEHFTEISSEGNSLNMGNYGSNVGAGDFEIFRITAMGIGASSTSRVMVQEHYGKRL